MKPNNNKALGSSDAKKAKKCRFCGDDYDESNMGLLQCYYHPRVFIPLGDPNGFADSSRFGAEHYLCCGASHRYNDHLHFERNMVRGCTRIDHCDNDEFRTIKEKSYVLIDLQLARDKHPVVNQSPLPDNVFIFENESDIPDQLTLHSSSNKTSLVFTGGALYNEFKTLSKQRLNAILSDFKRANYIEENRLVSVELIESFLEEGGEEAHQQVRLLLETKQALQSTNFQPFCLIRRVGSCLDPERVRGFNGNSLCQMQRVNIRINPLPPTSDPLPVKKRKFV